jgi:2-polyprenyl-3-methyl-5-hydroxy-6-metoxy-1,4-benzoquinol methylase
MNEIAYVGNELELFEHAVNWKRYWASWAEPFVRGEVLDVGAGLGVNARSLATRAVTRWTFLEPDPSLCAGLRRRLDVAPVAATTRIVTGTIQTIDAREQFDTILYIDVLEHIADDAEELRRSAGRLRSGGSLIVLAPAHQWLFTPFDRAATHQGLTAPCGSLRPAGCTHGLSRLSRTARLTWEPSATPVGSAHRGTD